MKFGKLTVIKPVKTKNSKYTQWLCRCDCGNEAVAYSYKLLAGRVKSCGCLMTNIHPYKALKQENAELKAENEILKSQLDFEVQKKEVFEIENERLKEENYQLQKDCQICENFIDFIPCKPIRDMDYDLQKVINQRDKYYQTLQEIKEIADAMYEDYSKRWDDNISEGLEQIIDLITKAKEE